MYDVNKNQQDKAVSFEDNVKVVRVARVDSGMLTELFYSVQDFLQFSKESEEETSKEAQPSTTTPSKRTLPRRQLTGRRTPQRISERQRKQREDVNKLQRMRELRKQA